MKVNLVLSPVQTGNQVYAEPLSVDYGQAAVWAFGVEVPDHLVGEVVAATDTVCVRDWTHPDIVDTSIFPN